MAKYTALDFAEDVLRTAELPLTFQELTEKGRNTEYFKKVGFTGKTPERTVGARLFVDAGKRCFYIPPLYKRETDFPPNTPPADGGKGGSARLKGAFLYARRPF